MEDIKVEESFLIILKCASDIWDVKYLQEAKTACNGWNHSKFTLLNICLMHEVVTGSAMRGSKLGDFALHFQLSAL